MAEASNQRIAPIDRASAAELVADRIRQAITDGVFVPGDHLTESQLTERLNVSRAPVREGLQRLIQEGLLTSEPHRGIFVPLLDVKDVEDVYLVRESIEREAVRHLCKTGRYELVAAELKEIVDDMEDAAKSEDWGRVSRADLQFHQHLVDARQSPRLSRMFRTVMVETRMCLWMLARANPVRNDLVKEHRELQRTIAAGDTEATFELLDDHFEQAMETLRIEITKRRTKTSDGIEGSA